MDDDQALIAEARAIIAGTTMKLASRKHLAALVRALDAKAGKSPQPTTVGQDNSK